MSPSVAGIRLPVQQRVSGGLMTKRIRTFPLEALISTLTIVLTLPLAGTASTPRSHPATQSDTSYADRSGIDLGFDDSIGFVSDDVLADLMALDILLDEEDVDPSADEAEEPPRIRTSAERARANSWSPSLPDQRGVAEALFEAADVPAPLYARTRHVYLVPVVNPPFAYAVTFAPTVATCTHTPEPCFRSILKPDSFALVSVHARLADVGDATVAVNPVGAVGAASVLADAVFEYAESPAAEYERTRKE